MIRLKLFAWATQIGTQLPPRQNCGHKNHQDEFTFLIHIIIMAQKLWARQHQEAAYASMLDNMTLCPSPAGGFMIGQVDTCEWMHMGDLHSS